MPVPTKCALGSTRVEEAPPRRKSHNSQEIHDLRETVDILEQKIAKLEQLVRLKDTKIAKLKEAR